MSKFWSRLTAGLEPYIPGEQPKDKKYIKLNTNENPYPPSPKVIEAIRQEAGADLRLYPDPNCDELRRTIAGYNGLDEDEVFIGNGSDEVLAFSFMAFFDPGNPILFNDITYSFYPVYARLFKLDYREVPLNEDYTVSEEAFYEENGGIVIANPNAPTSRTLSAELLKKVLEHNRERVVIVDEAYVDFCEESAVRFIHRYPNLLVVQTLSKSRSLAGLRVGFAMGNRELIDGLNRVKNSFNSYTLDRLALAGAKAAFEDEEYFLKTREKIKLTRNRVSEVLRDMGFTVLDSGANFIFISKGDYPAEGLYKALRERNILVRYFKKPRIDKFLRISIGTDDEMDAFISALSEILHKSRTFFEKM